MKVEVSGITIPSTDNSRLSTTIGIIVAAVCILATGIMCTLVACKMKARSAAQQQEGHLIRGFSENTLENTQMPNCRRGGKTCNSAAIEGDDLLSKSHEQRK